MVAPKRFVGLHCHTGASSFDGMGPASQHMDFVLKNGMDAWSLTDHGHMNGFAAAFLYNEKLKKSGKKFKLIPGCEMYVHPDLEQWKADKIRGDELAKDAKAAKAAAKKANEGVKTIIERVGDSSDETVEVETSNALTVENEDETKSGKSFNPVNRRHHLVVLPKTPIALQKIFKLVSRGYLEGFYRFPRVNLKMLKEAAGDDKDIIISSACLGGAFSYEVLSQLRFVSFDKLDSSILDDASILNKIVDSVSNTYDKYADAVGRDNVLIELQFNRLPAQDVVNRSLIEFARRNSLTKQLVVTADSHYASPDLWYHREMYKKLGYLNYTEYGPDSLPKSKESVKAELYPKNAEQVWEEYQKSKSRNKFYGDCDEIVSDAIERSYDVAHEVIQDITFDTNYRYPKSIIPAGKTPFQLLVEQCKEGMKNRGLDDKKEYIERLKHELGVIKKLDNAAYFVTLAKALDLARKVCLLGVARGSSGGSLVAYVLNITDLDPIKYECRFDRFMSIHRSGAPDIDCDIGDRDKVLDVLRNEFGYNNVVPISNYNLFKVKSLVKDVSKFYGIPFEEVNEATKTVEQDVRKATQKHGDDKNLFVLTFDDAMKYSPSFKQFVDKHPQVAESINILFKEQRSLGRHAGGVVILDDAPSMMPLITNSGEPQTPWVEGVGQKTLEPLGFIKYDLLGLETMRLISRAIELILERKEGMKNPTFDDVREWYEKNLHPDVNDYTDQKVYEYVYHQGRFAGIFQLTSAGAQKLFLAAKPRSIVDIAVLTSIYRPGPLAAKVDKLYLDARQGKKYDWGHPLFEKVLGKTDNLLIFQESVMDLAEHVGGFPKDQCDNVRRAIMKRDLSKGDAAIAEAKRLEDDFVVGAIKNGVEEQTARKAYQNILWFAGYGFNRAHAIAYAIDSYMCAWLLTYYEEEWLCAYLESMSNNPDDKAKAFGEIKGMGYQIVPIDINYATKTWTIIDGKRFMPSLLTCKGVGESAIDEIIENRPYNNLEEFLWNKDGTWRHSKFNKKALDALIKIEAFDSMEVIGPGRTFENYNQMHFVLVENNDLIKKSTKKDPNLGCKNFHVLVEKTRDVPTWTRSEKVENQTEYLGSADVSMIVDPEVLERLSNKGVKPIEEVGVGEKDICWFYVESQMVKKTKNGKPFLVISAAGLNGKTYKLNVWGWNDSRTLSPYSLCVCEVERNDFGHSTTSWKLKVIGEE